MREERVRDAAQALRQRLGLGHERVDPFDVLRQLGVEVVREPLGDGANALDGIYRVKDGQSFVYINSAKGLERQRFTAAHELGHHELDDVTSDARIIDLDVYRVDEPQHVEKNWFAGSFLIDAFGAKELYDRGLRGDALVAAAIERFDTSLQASAIELKRLGLLSRDVCDDLLNRREGFLVRDFLRAQGFKPRPDRRGEHELDPEFISHVRKRFVRGAIDANRLARALRMDPDTAAAWVRDQGLVVDSSVSSDEDLLSALSGGVAGDT